MVKLTNRQLEFLRFCIVGAINTGIDFTVFAVLYAWGVALFPAHALSYGCGIINSYILNRKWTFKNKPSEGSFEKPAIQPVKQMLQFTALNLFTLAITYEILVGVHYKWGWPMLLSRLFAIIASLVFNFAGSRLWVFRQPKLRSELG